MGTVDDSFTFTYSVSCTSTDTMPSGVDAHEHEYLSQLEMDGSSEAIQVDEQITFANFEYDDTRCLAPLDYRIEVAYLRSLMGASLNETFWNLCSTDQISWNDQTHCITYACRGQADLPQSDSSFNTLQQFQDNILQGVLLDAIITSIDLAAILIEYIVLPAVVAKLVPTKM